MEYDEKDLENVVGGLNMPSEEAKKFNKFKEIKEEPKELEKDELTEEDLERYMGGQRMDAYEAEKFTNRR